MCLFKSVVTFFAVLLSKYPIKSALVCVRNHYYSFPRRFAFMQELYVGLKLTIKRSSDCPLAYDSTVLPHLLLGICNH